MGKLEGKIVLVTGGNSGIGMATEKRFASEGAHVFITGRRDRDLAAAMTEIGESATGIQGDVSKLGDLDRLFSQIKEEKGRLNIVFANAGTAKYVSLAQITELHLRHQRQTPTFHGAEGASPVARRCFHHSQCVNRREQRAAIVERVHCNQGRGALVRAHMDN